MTSPETERYKGGDHRAIPLFPGPLPYLRDVFEQAEPGAEHVITRYREGNQNLRTQLQRIILKAGLKPWPKLFHNLRSTRQTELSEPFPDHVVCAWLGNSEKVARDHVLQVTDAHFGRAAKATEKATGQAAASKGTGGNPPQSTNENRPVFPGDSTPFRCTEDTRVTPTGFEPVSRP